MQDITNETIDTTTYTAINKYFQSLYRLGENKDYNKLLLLILINNILMGSMKYYITQDDYRIIDKALNCLYGTSCLMPYPEFINYDIIYSDVVSFDVFRATENNNFRLMEDSSKKILE